MDSPRETVAISDPKRGIAKVTRTAKYIGFLRIIEQGLGQDFRQDIGLLLEWQEGRGSP